MQNYSSENYKLYVTSTDDKAGMQKAHCLDLIESMMAQAEAAGRKPSDTGADKVVDWLRAQPSSFFACDSMGKSVAMKLMGIAAAKIGVTK